MDAFQDNITRADVLLENEAESVDAIIDALFRKANVDPAAPLVRARPTADILEIADEKNLRRNPRDIRTFTEGRRRFYVGPDIRRYLRQRLAGGSAA